jgi:PAP2 superfamily
MFGNRFPASLPAVADLTIHPVTLASAARNALPSVHFACALLIWWNVARLSLRWRLMAGVFLGMTMLATMGFGEHYLIDLVVAVPFALAMQAVCLKSTSWASDDRRVAFSGGAALTVLWIAVLRLGLLQNSPRLAWCSVVATLALSLWWKRRLALGHRGFEQEIFPVRSVILAEKS